MKDGELRDVEFVIRIVVRAKSAHAAYGILDKITTQAEDVQEWDASSQRATVTDDYGESDKPLRVEDVIAAFLDGEEDE